MEEAIIDMTIFNNIFLITFILSFIFFEYKVITKRWFFNKEDKSRGFILATCMSIVFSTLISLFCSIISSSFISIFDGGIKEVIIGLSIATIIFIVSYALWLIYEYGEETYK